MKSGGRPFGWARGRRVTGWFLEFVLTSVVLWIVFSMAGRVLPKIALRQISELTNTQIDVKSVDFRFDGFVFISDLVVRPHGEAEYDNSILRAKTVLVRFGLGSLLKFRPRMKEVFVDDFVLRAQYDSDNGEWNLSALKIQIPLSGTSRMPLIWLENGKVEYSRASRGRVRAIGSWPVSAGIRPGGKILWGGYSFDISPGVSRRNFDKSISASWRPDLRQIVVWGRILSKDVPGFERPWTMVLDTNLTYEPNGSYELSAKVKDLNFPPSETRTLFAFDTKSVAEKAPYIDALQRFFNKYNPSGRIDIDLRASGNFASIIESKIDGTVYCSDAAVCDRSFAYKVEHITGQIDVTEKSAKLNGLTGRHGEVELTLDGWAADFGPDWKYNLQITSDNMLLDSDLYNAINKEEQKFWSAFSPAGVAAINYSRSRLSPTEVQSALAVQLLDVEGRYAEFGYPLKHTKGMLFFGTDNVAFSDVVSEWDGRKITINGKANIGGEQPVYDFLIKGEDIPLDTTLAEALPAAPKEFYNQFEASGRFDATVKVFNSEGVGTFTAEIFPKNSSIKAKALPVVISDVTGKVVFNPEVLDIEELSGRYGAGTVGLSGRVWPAGKEKELGYCLSMRAKKIELKEEMMKTLPKPLAELVGQLRPSGEVSLTADMSRNGDSNCGADRLIIECLGNTIECNLLPYPLRDISGRIVITQSQIALEDVTARALHTIQGAPVESVMKITGKVVMGESGEGGGMQIMAGDVNFSGENVRFKGKSLARVDTVLGYDAKSGQWLSRHFVADFYDGKMIGKFQLNKSVDGGLDYLLEASVAGADLKRFLSDTEKESRPDEHYSSGSINGSLSVVGSIVDDSIRLGRCRVKIIDMEVGKMSPLANLLTVLKLTEPSDYAFDQMTVDAYIQDNRMFFRQFDLSGKSLAFDGSGWLDLKTDNINLTLTARGKRLATASPSILQSLTEGLGRAVMRVEVKGQANDPQVTTKPLPVIRETLEILGTPRGE
jgi:hypothetical protein